MHHYTYLIQHKNSAMRYIGVRSSECIPTEDTSYWGSSKHLPADVHITHVKIILKEFPSRKEAVTHEIELHTLNNVAINGIFYNKAKQTSTGFDTTGKSRVFTKEHKANLSKAQTRNVNSSSYKNPREGAILSVETIAKISESKKNDKRPLYIRSPKFKPWFISSDTVTHLFYDMTKSEYANANGYAEALLRDSCTRSKGTRKLTRGKLKGMIVGNIPQSN